MSIRLRLTLLYSALLAIALLVFGVTVYMYAYFNTFNELKKRIQQESARIEVFSSFDFFDFNLDLRRFRSEELFVQLVNFTNGRIRQTDNLFNANIRLPYPGAPEIRTDEFRQVEVDGLPFLVYNIPIPAGQQIVGVLQVAAYTETEWRLLDNIRRILLVSALVILLIAFSLGLVLARKALAPIEHVIDATRQIEGGANLSVRIPRSGPNDEMGRLTDTLNGMLERLERAYNELDEAYMAQRRFVSDASHELRTPLTTIRGNIELLEKMWSPVLRNCEQAGETVQLAQAHAELSLEAMQDIAGEARRMSRLVGDLLSLARADAGFVMEKTELLLLPLVEEVARRAQLLPRQVELQVSRLQLLEGVRVKGNADYLRQLLFIFIENAFKYTLQGEVELQGRRENTQAGIVIRDTGIGMHAEEVPHIFERFYRADVSRGQTSGTGLGLSIAKWIIDEHGGSIEVQTRQGEGTTFVIWLPIVFSEEAASGILEEEDADRAMDDQKAGD